MNTIVGALRAEFTKFRTVRGWVVATVVGGLAIVAFGLAPGFQGSCGQHGPGSECVLPVGPEGEEIVDNFTFVHQPLAGDGSVTVRITALTGRISGADPTEPVDHLVPWAKAGLIIKAGTAPGSAYAAVMVTGDHGVRMQYDYTHDQAGKPGAVGSDAPRWLRLTREGDTVTAAESPDGTMWTAVGSATLNGLPTTVQVGLFVTSPQYAEEVRDGLSSGAMGGPSQATATFDHLTRSPDASAASAWSGEIIGGGGNSMPIGADPVEQVGDRFTVTGSGDIAPAVDGASGLGVSVSQTLVGTFVGLIVVVVVAAMFVTAEYRRRLIRTTLTASPHRGVVLAAKVVVAAGVSFVVGLIAATVVVVFGQQVLRGNGVYVHPASTGTELRLIVGTGALLAVAAALALGLGLLLRRGVTAVTTAVVVIVLPYLLAVTVLPLGAAQWLLRVSPAAAFSVQQAAKAYPQVDNLYTPADGYFPLTAWAGFAVLLGWAVVTLGLAAIRLRRADA